MTDYDYTVFNIQQHNTRLTVCRKQPYSISAHRKPRTDVKQYQRTRETRKSRKSQQNALIRYIKNLKPTGAKTSELLTENTLNSHLFTP